MSGRRVTSTPACYLSRYADGGGRIVWTVIYRGAPLCAPKATREEAEAAAKAIREVPGAVWDGEAGRFEELEP